MKSSQSAIFILPLLTLLLACPDISSGANLITLEAESGALGADFATINGDPDYIAITSNSTGNNPGSSARVATYSVMFPVSGDYELYARVRVGSGTFDDDSMFFGSGFGTQNPTVNSDWVFVNGLASAGYTASNDIVTGAGGAGSQVWKWINLSQFAGAGGFSVSAGNLTRTFQIGAREDGLDLDKFVFGTAGAAVTVSNLDSGTVPPPPPPPTNAFPNPDGIAIHRFSPIDDGINADGANPAAGLALSGGVLIGTTLNGGLQGAGTMFSLSLDGTNFNTLRSFANEPDAGNSQGELSVSGDGFFGTTFGGGNNGAGTVFLGLTNGDISLLRSFATVQAHTATNSGGASPSALLARSGGMLYGTTAAGGAAANGTVYSLATNGSAFSVLHEFALLDSQTGTNSDGASPWGGLILSGDRLYGTASAGGAGGNGIVFSIRTNGSDFNNLHDFSPMDVLTATNSDGAIPFGGLVFSNGTLYGTTFTGGHGGSGTVYSVETNGLGFTVLHHFTKTDSVTATNTDGASPAATLLLSGNVLTGTASMGGEGAAGTVFSLALNGGRFDTLHNFTPLSSSGTNRYGAFPVSPLLQAGSSLFGTTFAGGPGAAGTVFSVSYPGFPAVITNIVNNTDGSVTIYFLGGPDSTNVVQATSDLAPPVSWQNVSTNFAGASGEWQFDDSADDASRFYRSYTP